MLYITIRYISWFMISMNELLLVYFICILDYGYDVRQKVNSSDFFFYSNSNWVTKQQRQLETSTMHLAQELLVNV